MKAVVIILARAGSKGIPDKNIINFCEKPLLLWTIEQFQEVEEIDSIWVSSDGDKILDIAKKSGCHTIRRPKLISGSDATSASGVLHAIDIIEKEIGQVDIIIAPQVTSPIRELDDIEKAIEKFKKDGYDSMFSCNLAGDLCLWSKDNQNELVCTPYNCKNPHRRRQDLPVRYVENGSFYIFTPASIRKYGTYYGGKKGVYLMDSWKVFQIDEPIDLRICETIMKEFL